MINLKKSNHIFNLVLLFFIFAIPYFFVSERIWLIIYILGTLAFSFIITLTIRECCKNVSYIFKDKEQKSWIRASFILGIIIESLLFSIFPGIFIYNSILGFTNGIVEYKGECNFNVEQYYSSGRTRGFNISYRIIIPEAIDPLVITKEQYLELGGDIEFTEIKDKKKIQEQPLKKEYKCDGKYQVKYLNVMQSFNSIFELKKIN